MTKRRLREGRERRVFVTLDYCGVDETRLRCSAVTKCFRGRKNAGAANEQYPAKSHLTGESGQLRYCTIVDKLPMVAFRRTQTFQGNASRGSEDMSSPHISTGPVGEAGQTFTGMRAVVVGASPELALAFAEVRMANDLPVRVEVQSNIDPHQLPSLLAGSQIAIVATTVFTKDLAQQCKDLRHVIFLSDETYGRADIQMLESLGIMPHTVGRSGTSTPEAIADSAIEQCRRIVSPTGG